MPNYIVSGDAYLTLPREPHTWLIKNILPVGGSVLLYGDPKIGKSYAGLQMALALATGEDWLGFPVLPNCGPVIYVQLDTPRSLWAERIELLKASGEPTNLLHLVDLGTLGTWPFDILDPEHRGILQSALSSYQPTPAVVIIDTLREVHSGEENDSTNMRNVIAALMAAIMPAALVLVSHSRKPSQDHTPDIMADARGSSYVVGKMDTIVKFSKRGMHYDGRAIEAGSLRLARLENGFWAPKDENLEHHIAGVLADPSLTTGASKARKLAELTGKTEEACRSLLRRHKMSTATVQAPAEPLPRG